MKVSPIIGLEVHVQLLTRTKIFCGCPNLFNPTQPNVQTCPVCLGLPGSLPVLNRRALELSVTAGLALGGTIAPVTKWDRKQYYYPDLPKAYQISQYDLPLCDGGFLDVAVEAEDGTVETSRVRLIRVHLEEDAGKNLHDESGQGGDSRVDLNRAGTPLLEIVSEPDLTSSAQARAYLEQLKLLLVYLGISDCNMQEGSLRCDANVNIEVLADDGQSVRTPIVEIKNLNSFRGVEAAVRHEVTRQAAECEARGGRYEEMAKQTRGWNADRNTTFAQRGKEEASDYRYIPDPDLLPVSLSEAWVEEIRGRLREPPLARRGRFESELGLSAYDAGVLIGGGPAVADYFETVAKDCGDAKLAANWVTQDVLRELNERQVTIDEFAVSGTLLAALLCHVGDGRLTTGSARTVFAALLERAEGGGRIDEQTIGEIVEAEGLARVADTGQLDEVLEEVIAANAGAAEDFRGGKQAAIGKLIGEVMRRARGADPQQVREALIERLKS